MKNTIIRSCDQFAKLPFFSSMIIGSAFEIYVNLSVDVVGSLKQCVQCGGMLGACYDKCESIWYVTTFSIFLFFSLVGFVVRTHQSKGKLITNNDFIWLWTLKLSYVRHRQRFVCTQ